MRVFLVEDEALIRMMIRETVDELGHEVVAEARLIEEALTPARTAAFDIALLDVNLHGRRIDMVSESRGLLFTFVTGYSRDALPDAFQRYPHLQKPLAIERFKAFDVTAKTSYLAKRVSAPKRLRRRPRKVL